MRIWILLIVLVGIVLLCDKFEDRLPPPVRWMYALWKKFSHYLGMVMSFLILTVLWIVGFGIYAVILKLITLPKRFQSDPDTYWITIEPTTTESMKHQF